MTRHVLMGDPTYFHITGGANPFTRNWWGVRRRVDRKKATEQWNQLRDLLTGLGVVVHVIPPDLKNPGLVYPANAGVMLGNRFVLSNLIPSRAGERPVYDLFLRKLGIDTASIRSRFEGEADLIPVGDRWFFTYGAVIKQRFVPQIGFPPWRRVFGFRSERRALDELRRFVGEAADVIDFELALESHYHGDTVLCSFGVGRRQVMAYLGGLTPESQARLRHLVGNELLELSTRDAFFYAANGFQVEGPEGPDGPTLILPDGVSESLLAEVARRGVTPVTVDVSEFLKKGGGAVKCMIGDLGDIPS